MQWLNPFLMPFDFKAGPSRFNWSMRPTDISAFSGKVQVVTLPPGFRLFKLSAGSAEAHATFGVTPWWSAVYPYREDYEGAIGRFEQAKLNKIDMSSMVRYMSAVCIDWNDLDNYIEVTIRPNVRISCFWGRFAPQAKFSSGVADAAKEARVSSTRSAGYSAAILPNDLGVLPAWQFYIPGLRDEHIQRSSVLCAHDMSILAQHFSRARR